ncbi:MAG: carbamoyltransferase [Candidatus Omnitrophica bacterium]|nr:carbamoyltransferase [Candidatus Omnitrophota bacterium]
MKILGLNAYHGDSAACLVVDGRLVAAAEEERFRRVKHWAGFPAEAIRYCLESQGLALTDIDHIAVNRDPSANLMKKALFVFSKRPNLAQVTDRLKNSMRVKNISDVFADLKADIHHVEHHRAHLASAFFASGFENAALVSLDGFGDFSSGMWGKGEKNKIKLMDQVYFPHSLGLFYLAMTQYLGFPNYGDEYKLMGLAGYGRPTELEKLREIMKLKSLGGYELNLDYFLHHSEGVPMVWEGGSPTLGIVYSSKMEKLFGPARKPDSPVEGFHKDLAASVQRIYEEAFFHVLNAVYEKTGDPNLCLAGGCALNGVANGKIKSQTRFQNFFIQPAAGDAGGALGAAFWVWHHELEKPRCFVMDHVYWGPEFSEAEVSRELETSSSRLKEQHCSIQKLDNEEDLCTRTAAAIAGGKIIGWFQGRMEWGPRALGNRSVLADPRRADMKAILNLKIKHRESFRPFAPSVLSEKASAWFEMEDTSPFMLTVCPVRPDKRTKIPAVTHVDGTARPQTVAQDQNPLFYKLIAAFDRLTGVPVLLNTSFNENEPIVRLPREAIECFLRTRMDILVIDRHWIERFEDTHS